MDAWIVPEAKPVEPDPGREGKKKKKDRKGKGKERDDGNGASKTKKSKKKRTGDVQEMTQEEIAEAEALATVSTVPLQNVFQNY